ncbi:MAG: efflux RND transporter periplasmic adaptor subunit [Phycisphaerales bacterium]
MPSIANSKSRSRGAIATKATIALVLLAGGAIGVHALAQDGNAGASRATESAPKTENKSSSDKQSKARTADLAEVKRQAFEITTVANGDLQARNQIEVRSPLEQQSTIQFIVPEGTRVKKGDLIVQLNADQIQRQIDEETPRLASARAELVSAENQLQIQTNDNASSLRKAELELTLAELALNQWRDGDAVKQRQNHIVKLDTSKLELERLAEKYLRSQELLAEGFLSKDECDRDEVAYIRAISDYQTSILDLQVFDSFEFVRTDKQKISDVAERRAEVERVRLNNDSQLTSRKADRDNRSTQVALTESRLKKLQDQLSGAKMVAPTDGLVVYSTSVEGMRWGGSGETLQIGQQVYPNQLIIALPDTSDMLAVVRVHEAMAGRIRPGQDVAVKIDAAGGKVFQGKVDSIGVMAESGGWRDPNLREYSVKIALQDVSAEDGLKPAMRVEGRVMLDKVPEALTVPVQALFAEGALQYVYRPEGSKFVKHPVRAGRRSETTAEITAGLSERDVVLLRTPQPGEVLTRAWDDEALKIAGYKRDEQGQIVAERPAGRPGGPGGGGQGRRGQQPQKTAETSADDTSQPKTDDKAVGATTTPTTEKVADSATATKANK